MAAYMEVQGLQTATRKEHDDVVVYWTKPNENAPKVIRNRACCLCFGSYVS